MPDLTPEDLATLQTAALALVAAAFTALTVLAIAAGRRALSYLSKLTGIRESDAITTAADNAITASIHFAEEWANKRIRKLGAVGAGVDGEDKRAVAKDFARSMAPKALAHVSDQHLDMLVDAKVQSMRPWLPTGDSVAPSLAPGGTVYRPTSIPPLAALPSFPAATPTPLPPRPRP